MFQRRVYDYELVIGFMVIMLVLCIVLFLFYLF